MKKLYIALVLGSFWLVYLMVKDYQITANTVRHEIKQFDANEVSVKLAMVHTAGDLFADPNEAVVVAFTGVGVYPGGGVYYPDYWFAYRGGRYGVGFGGFCADGAAFRGVWAR